MTLDVDTHRIVTTEFGVGRKNPTMFYSVPVDGSVQKILREMVGNTVDLLERGSEHGVYYQASEKYESTEYCYLDARDPMAQVFYDVARATNLDIDSEFPNGLETVTCYFARLTDDQGRQLTGFRRAAQFKAMKKRTILRWMDDSLRQVDDSMFKLDNDFDLLIDSERLHVLRPRGLETLGNLKGSILDAVKGNVAHIGTQMPGLDLGSVASYASTRIRAARYLASICRQDVGDIDMEALKRQCAETDVMLERANGRLTPSERDVMGFLEVLDRRRFGVELVRDSREVYRASSRRKVGGM